MGLMTCVVLFMLMLSMPATASSDDMILGAWTCLAQSDDGEMYVFTLELSAQGRVRYTTGWYQSEIAGTFMGQYTVEAGNRLRLDMTESESTDHLRMTCSYSVSDNALILTKQTGDWLSYLFDTGVPMEFVRAHEDEQLIPLPGPPMDDAMWEQLLKGSWCEGPSVGSGYGERWLFTRDELYIEALTCWRRR
jgi:hypothetical protein